MNTDGRLMRAYNKAKEIHFDDSSKLVFLSDVHREIIVFLMNLHIIRTFIIMR